MTYQTGVYGRDWEKAAEALSEIDDPAALDFFLRAAKLDDEIVRLRAKLKEEDAKHGVKRDEKSLAYRAKLYDESTRCRALKCLGWFKDSKAIDALIENLLDNNNNSWLIRSSAADSLGHLRDERAVKPLLEAMLRYPTEPPSILLSAGAIALNRINSGKTIETCIQLMLEIINRYGRLDWQTISAIKYVLSEMLKVQQCDIEPLMQALNDQYEDSEEICKLGKDILEKLRTGELKIIIGASGYRPVIPKGKNCCKKGHFNSPGAKVCWQCGETLE
jgi:hypothetical protein